MEKTRTHFYMTPQRERMSEQTTNKNMMCWRFDSIVLTPTQIIHVAFWHFKTDISFGACYTIYHDWIQANYCYWWCFSII